MANIKRKYGLKLSPTHGRQLFKVPAHIASIADVPDTDYSAEIPYVLNQGEKGTCVDHACGLAEAHVSFKQHPELGFQRPSCLFTSYNHRAKIGAIDDDPGSSGFDYCEEARINGVPPEALWPYDLSKWTVQPSPEVYDAGKKNQVIEFQHIPIISPAIAINLIRVALFVNKHGLPWGANIFADFEAPEVAESGCYYKTNGQDIQGGHETYIVGAYRNGVSIPFLRIQNSWGDWGKAGLNGLRGYVDIAESVFAQMIIEANVLTKTE